MRHLAAFSMIALLAFSASAQVTPDMMQRLEKVQGGKLNGEALGKAMVIGTLVGCTQKQAGKQQTEAFYNSIEKVSKEAEALCEQNRAADARALVLRTIDSKRNDPVTLALLQCYDSNAVALQQMGGTKLATDTAHYTGLLRDSKTAATELKESDVCHNLKPSTTK